MHRIPILLVLRLYMFRAAFVTRSRMALNAILLLVVNSHHNCIKCTKADVRLRTPDDGQKGCPKHVDS